MGYSAALNMSVHIPNGTSKLFVQVVHQVSHAPNNIIKIFLFPAGGGDPTHFLNFVDFSPALSVFIG